MHAPLSGVQLDRILDDETTLFALPEIESNSPRMRRRQVRFVEINSPDSSIVAKSRVVCFIVASLRFVLSSRRTKYRCFFMLVELSLVRQCCGYTTELEDDVLAEDLNVKTKTTTAAETKVRK